MFEEDPSLLPRYRDGDVEVLTMLYDRYVQSVARTLRAGFTTKRAGAPVRVPGVASTFEIEELCQEIFIKAFGSTARATFDGARSFQAFLIGIARNHRIDTLRRWRPRLVEAPNLDVAAAITPADEALADRQLSALVQGFIDALGEPDRSYYTFRFREGLSQTDAATRIGLGRTPARGLERGLKRRLLSYLERHGYCR